jgi:hypothetical protein
METLSAHATLAAGEKVKRPHSLGTLIEWKPARLRLGRVFSRPHSLGTLIEWKPRYLNYDWCRIGINKVPTRWGH